MGDPRSTAFESGEVPDRSAAVTSTGGDAPTSDLAGTPDDADDSFDTPDPTAERDRIRAFLDDAVAAANAEGVVVNLSGGLDSTVTAALAVEALGADRVYGLILPCNKVGAPHARDAEALADALGIDHDTVHLQPLFAQFGAVAPDRFDLHDEPIRSGNAIARLRMAMAYLAANATNRLVCGTTNRSEHLLGYVTKHGDGAADLLPLGHLYKTDVRALAEKLDVPEFVVEKPPTAGFLPGQRDADDLGAPYDVIDAVLRLGVDRGLAAEAIADRLASGVDEETVTDLLARHRASAHKRTAPPMPTRRRD
ncbi:NAD(+) synthase (glutamine-hydrolyzing) 2 [Halorubrum saccharovorum DSM 1137]|uniref:NH(3)-dependent NAD(+) synthetase n=1 Tax=Halorubrum saccharovorum DSM 1137 TaxID=1227484 RepID=M0E873_9EURY|nr:NAD+ synthase [Halorubrum saccharovorum]ELZ43122.1 NAD(+) synthase (glutamine-hydrolyzing) 2 [Halorubrum saccharovorum DSM 1137]